MDDAAILGMNEAAAAVAGEAAALSKPLLNLWYYALPAKALKRGQMKGLTMLGQPILLLRDDGGAVAALRDLCPHRGVALSAGRFDGAEVSCPFHGWRFDRGGQCTAIPSKVGDGGLQPGAVKLRSFPARERQGSIWVFIGAPEKHAEAEAEGPPQVPGIPESHEPAVVTRLLFDTDVDNAIYGLLDPAHTPYVHEGLLWRKSNNLREKTKHYAPSAKGFVMVRHQPTGNTTAYKLLGGKPSTEISFNLPGIRIEHIEIGRHAICNVTAATPLNERQTIMTNLLYWTNPWLNVGQPVMRLIAKRFLKQDQWIIGLQNRSAHYRPTMMLVDDADRPQRWYLRLKREWIRAQASGEPFANPLKATSISYRS